MRQRGMDSSACPGTSHRGLQSGIINLLRQTHARTSGATQFGRSPAMRFPSRRRAVQFGQYGAVLTLESLGRRWGWEKTKVWRFFRKHADAFPLYKLPGAFGCLTFNAVYPTGEQFTLPSQDKVERILREIRTKDGIRTKTSRATMLASASWSLVQSCSAAPGNKRAPCCI